ncbi:PAS domain S-box protein [Azospirillum sp.]|uniref:PAS domain S-box protein n=1 Tax=Azospirillum sp. TaxID=34012 RepID=UPI002D71C6EC|nr:PAS domain S-box protein [Azospirillum sp.]HYF89503.1 PAS domain S-box protein [Azospirillum sp.]
MIRDATPDGTGSRSEVEAPAPSPDQLQDMFAELDQVLWFLRADGSVRCFNRVWCSYTGLAATMDGLSWIEAFHPDDRSPLMSAHTAGITGGVPYTVEARMRRADGAYRRHLCRVKPLRRDDGVYAWIGTAIDVEDIRGAEERQRSLIVLGDRLRDITDTGEIAWTGAAAIGTALDLVRAGYAGVEGDLAIIERDWVCSSDQRPAAGTYRISDWGTFLAPLGRGETVIVRDIETDPLTADAAAGWLEWGIRAVAFVPLLKDERLAGYMFLHARTTRTWAAEELDFIRNVTDRVWSAIWRSKADQSLRERERRLVRQAELLEQTHDAMVVRELGGAILSWNRSAERLFGFSAEEALGRCSHDLLRSELPLPAAEFDGMIEREGTWTADMVHIARDGRRIVVESRQLLVVEPDGRRLVLETNRDVTEQREAQAAILASEERLRLAFSAGRLAAWEWDIASGRVTWSDQLFVNAGLQEQGFDGTFEAFLALVHPEDRCAVETAIAAALAAEADYAVEFRMVKPDGSVRWTSSCGRVVRDASGQPMRMVGYDADVTERRGVEEKLRQSESRFRSFAENSTDVLWIADAATGRLDYLSPAYEGIWGEPRDRVMDDIGRWAELVHPEDRAVASQGFPIALAGGAHTVDYRIIRPSDGTVRWIRDAGFGICGATGQVERVAGIAQDITEIKMAEVALRESEAKFQTIANSVDQMIWSTRPDGFHDYYNRRWYECTGVPEGSTDGGAWIGVIHPEDRDQARDVWQHALATGEPYHIEYRLRHRSGRYRWVIARAQCVRDAEGRIVRWYGTCTDVDELKRTADELRRTSALLRLIGNSIPDVIYAKDRDSRLLYANPSIVRVTGRPVDAMLGSNDRVWAADPAEAERVIANDRRVMETGDTFDVDETFTHLNGETRYYRSVKAPLRDEAGAIIGLVGITSDMTERRKAEERERLLAREVDHRAKNLLTVVQSIVQLTRADDIDSFTAATIGRIQSLARAHSLLAASRWEGAELKPIIEEELAPFAVKNASRVRMSGPSIRLRPEAAQAIALVVHELATNAAKYGALSRESGRLDVTWAVTVGSGEAGRLGLRWQERGGPPVRPPSRRGFGSTVMRASVERQLQGQVSLDWNPDGLVCELTIPAEQLSAGMGWKDARPTETTAAWEAATDLSGRRVLVVEDEALVALQIEASLAEAGCTVVGPASRVGDAFDLLYGQGADAALLDVNLAGAHSFAIAEILAAKRIPFAFVTGYEAVSTVTERFKAIPVIAKPFAPRTLMRVLGAMIAGQTGTWKDARAIENG